MTVVRPSTLPFADLPGRKSADVLAGIRSQSSVRHVRLQHDPSRTAHRHPHSEEIIHVVSGVGHLWLDGERLPVTSGDIVHVPTGAAHATIPEPGVAMELLCFFPHPDLAANIEETDIPVCPGGDDPPSPIAGGAAGGEGAS